MSTQHVAIGTSEVVDFVAKTHRVDIPGSPLCPEPVPAAAEPTVNTLDPFQCPDNFDPVLVDAREHRPSDAEEREIVGQVDSSQ